jgi:hypothetical protein
MNTSQFRCKHYGGARAVSNGANAKAVSDAIFTAAIYAAAN